VPRKRELYIQRYWREWSKRYAEVRLRLKREEYEILRKLADSRNMTVKAFLLDIVNQIASIEKEKNELMNKLKLYEKDIQLVNQLQKDLFDCRNKLKSMELSVSKCREYEQCCNRYREEYNKCFDAYNMIEQSYVELEKRLREAENRNKMLSEMLEEVMGLLSSSISAICWYEERYVSWRKTDCRQWEDKLSKIKDKMREKLHINI